MLLANFALLPMVSQHRFEPKESQLKADCRSGVGIPLLQGMFSPDRTSLVCTSLNGALAFILYEKQKHWNKDEYAHLFQLIKLNIYDYNSILIIL